MPVRWFAQCMLGKIIIYKKMFSVYNRYSVPAKIIFVATAIPAMPPAIPKKMMFF